MLRAVKTTERDMATETTEEFTDDVDSHKAGDLPSGSATAEEETEALDELEAEELDMLTEDETSDASNHSVHREFPPSVIAVQHIVDRSMLFGMDCRRSAVYLDSRCDAGQ